jgi:hypothetical protein
MNPKILAAVLAAVLMLAAHPHPFIVALRAAGLVAFACLVLAWFIARVMHRYFSCPHPHPVVLGRT